MWHWILDIFLVACILLFMIDKLTFLWVRRCYDIFYSFTVRTNGYLIFIDIDDFKAFNTNFGHKIGDKILREVGKVLLKESKLKAFRYGGDEMVILLPWSSREYAFWMACEIKEEVRRRNIRGLNVTVSCVVAKYEEQIKSLLKQAKENGKNYVAIESGAGVEKFNPFHPKTYKK